ncbi:MAG: HIT family protein [Patescibacteria group bacterium]|nr:HIT family protein [Patescibacteria group bacterium]MDE1944023.1 HIT family protein [Patescibacteria group bacterium]MDE2057791.1 HIT family protein [Patescibacteria group bacterium]
MKECPFCTRADIRERAIVENDLAWAFPTNIPITPGHTLVVPKRCVATLAELTPEERLAILDMTVEIQEALKSAFGAEGFNVAWNHGGIGGQSVPHFHLHIVPRRAGDEGITEYEPRKFLYRPGSREESPQAELAAVAKLVASGRGKGIQ